MLIGQYDTPSTVDTLIIIWWKGGLKVPHYYSWWVVNTLSQGLGACSGPSNPSYLEVWVCGELDARNPLGLIQFPYWPNRGKWLGGRNQPFLAMWALFRLKNNIPEHCTVEYCWALLVIVEHLWALFSIPEDYSRDNWEMPLAQCRELYGAIKSSMVLFESLGYPRPWEHLDSCSRFVSAASL